MPAAFASCGCLILSHCHVSAPRSPRRADLGHRALQWDHAARTRVDPAPSGMARLLMPSASREWHAPDFFPPAGPGGRPVHALPPAPAAPACARSCIRFPSLSHAVVPALPDTQCRGPRRCHSRRAFPHLSSPEVPSLRQRYPASPVVRTSPPPCPARPVPLRDSGLARARHRQPALPVLLLSPSCMHATVKPPELTGARVARFPATGSLPRFVGGSASALPFSRAQRSPRCRLHAR